MSDLRIDELDDLERPYFDDFPEFEPFGSPAELLELGIFDGTYFKGNEYDLPPGYHITVGNYFGVSASKPRSWWIEKNLITPHDPLGWFQWYLNFYLGRRCSVDQWQINRQINFVARHGGAVRKLGEGRLHKRRKQRQALLHWAANPAPDCIS